ncbi:MAG: Ldh family oxidoreductase, partial [Sulfolobales archaeon]
AIDPALFRKLEEVEEAIENYARLVKSLPRDPNTEVIIPGERAAKCVEERSQRGIPLDDETFSRLAKIAEELGISVTELTSPIPKV